VPTADGGLRILVAAPVYWPAVAFGGPIAVLRELVRGLSERGHDVRVVTSSLVELGRRGNWRTTVTEVDGADVLYAATPFRFRWMGITPTAWQLLERLPRPDVVHVFGFRDPIGSIAARWAHHRDVPYAFEALGMFAPKLRKVRLKRALDETVLRGVYRCADLAIAASTREADEYRAGGIAEARIAVRPNGFPPVLERAERPGRLRRLIGVDADVPVVLSVGRIARGKGLELVVEAARTIPDAHVAIVGPDDRHGLLPELERLRTQWKLRERVHLLGPLGGEPPLDVYADADVFVLASAHENFGIVAAEAAAAGTAAVVSDRCGIAELVRDRGALVVPYDASAVRDAIARLLGDSELRARLGEGGREVARSFAWNRIVAEQESLYRRLTR
jgi:glycosyltransferase involved in cell wall biosynthesis